MGKLQGILEMYGSTKTWGILLPYLFPGTVVCFTPTAKHTSLLDNASHKFRLINSFYSCTESLETH